MARSLWALLLCVPGALWSAPTTVPTSWVPARWQGGPLEIARRTKDKTLPSDPAARQAIERWYEAATLGLLEGTPVNCLLATWSTGAEAALERKQQELVRGYAREAHLRGIAVLGVVYPGADPASFVPPAGEAELDGLVLEGAFPGGDAFVRQVQKALQARNHAAIVIPLVSEPGPLRKADWPILATAGSWPRARLLSEMGVQAAPSSEAWIDSNIWLIRTFHSTAEHRPVWLGHLPATTKPDDYLRAVADAAIAGGRWIVALDDALRAGLDARQPAALETWHRIGGYLKFYQDHADWASFAAQGRLGIVLDKSSPNGEVSDEYFNLIARRQVPYRVIDRAGLSAKTITGLDALLVADLPSPTAAERNLLTAFAEGGGLLIAGHSWGGDVPKEKTFVERATGKGRVIVYQDDLPDPEAVSKDVRDLLRDRSGIRVFNMPSVLTYVAAAPAGKPTLVQLLNYSNYPEDTMTIRVAGEFRKARFYTPENQVQDLEVDKAGTATEIIIPNLAMAGALLLE